MAPRQRRLVSQPSAEELSSSPSETSSKSSAEDHDSYQTIDYRTKADIAKEQHDLFNLFALVRTNGLLGTNQAAMILFGNLT